MKPQDFKTKYAHTLHTDPITKQSYIKIPVADLSDLTYMQHSLLHALSLLSILEDGGYDDEQLKAAMSWLCKILLDSYPKDEIDGLCEWLETS